MKILLIGQGPLPLTGQSKPTNAPGFRAWHFAKALSEAGHKVELVSVEESGNGAAQTVEPNITLQTTDKTAITQQDFLGKLVKEIEPDAVVAANIEPGYLAALYLPPDLPLWADLFGSPLAEAQAKAALTHDDSGIETYARYERTVLSRADKFSSVSNPQKYALVGALATFGRLRATTYGYEFVHTIPAALEPKTVPHSQNVLRGKIVPTDSFVVLWSGGYNTWTDIDTLFAGLEGAMAANPNLNFVSTGGALGSHDAETYPRFEKLVASSPYADRYHLLGWLPLEQVPNFYYEANLGIILDKFSYEGELGSRTRLVEWLKYGLPAVTTVTAELTAQLVTTGVAYSFPHGDAPALSELLLKLSQTPDGLKAVGQRGQQYALTEFSYTKVCQPLVQWATAPHRAPDAALPPAFAATATALEQQVAALTSTIEAKNQAIAELEAWAHSLETDLKNNKGIVSKIKGRLFGKTAGE